ncbi:MAG TPA: hypothetical protein VFH37_01905 [Candidatus Saccharimonadales bacterium]|nr:hypothetical protein [Candidatus Saccharimonadales bacterium]
MEGEQERLSDEEIRNRIPEVFARLQKAAEKQGMHEQPIAMCETFLCEAYRCGLQDGQ